MLKARNLYSELYSNIKLTEYFENVLSRNLFGQNFVLIFSSEYKIKQGKNSLYY